ncbi:hypothetical protein KUV80_15210 [Fictibacillus nanhaiensis]|uniref:hypothetical protein n=1 Tax=Fictibacillus nanhaiensis TaxID=742169 RepID=UPI001C96186D|nr:hypothetical protein [Fictibacillus nanhaiensis]MBY6038022.1 hypothetical protein [Fictibacillus nanhaiensis]
MRQTRHFINIGFIKGVIVPYSAIQELKRYEGPDAITSEEKKYTFEALVSDFIPAKPSIDLILKKPIQVRLIYGFKKMVTRVVIQVDDSAHLMKTIEKRMSSEKELI